MNNFFFYVIQYIVPRKVLKDRYDTAPEPDEPQQIDLEQDQDDLYDDDQFYRENEAIPPAPKLQGGPNKNKFSDISTVATLAGFDIIDRIKGDDNNLEGMYTHFYSYRKKVRSHYHYFRFYSFTFFCVI